jgi:O-antigen ligase
MGINHPFLGVGENNFGYNNTVGGRPHNFLLSVWAQWGIIAFSCLALVLVRSTKVIYFSLKSNLSQDPVFIIVCLMIIAGLSHAFVSPLFASPLGKFSSIIVIGFLLSYMTQYSQQSISMRNRYQILLSLCILLCIFSITIIPLIWFTIP